MTTWRVLTWNILGSHRPNLDVLAEVIVGYSPDVIALQEIRRRQAKVLARHLDWRFVWTRKHYPFSPLVWWRAEGLAIATPHQIGEPVSISISPGVSTWTFHHRVAMALTVTRGGDALRLANTHLASHDADERIAQAARVASIVGARRPAVVAGDFHPAHAVEGARELPSP